MSELYRHPRADLSTIRGASAVRTAMLAAAVAALAAVAAAAAAAPGSTRRMPSSPSSSSDSDRPASFAASFAVCCGAHRPEVSTIRQLGTDPASSGCGRRGWQRSQYLPGFTSSTYTRS